ncbi:peptidoglycan-binding domain-containing protein [Flaviaesturariibacter aridisoli]|uniref:Peptidoglycan-binding protein n=1 Tax=Flaviaesturariibacter aridisoli TaxID=2545761 RepID=A0A4R4E1A1_9BACT|nr:peptidoglycan-binding domain-containing protein [Flaviaesturariibacter aridisoli]TCZ68351.1 peptidoglycan-binding protein [Flaviaesturariibacter aridisoli]
MKAKTKKKAPPKKQQKKTLILTAFAVGASGILGYFGWQYFRKKREARKNADLDALIKAMPPAPVTPDTPAPAPRPRSRANSGNGGSDDFPLKKGSKGENVRMLQEALIKKYGAKVLPRFGADGDFGTELVSALRRQGLPTVVTESTFNVLTQGSRPSDNLPSGKELYEAALSKDFAKTIGLLKRIGSVDQYSTVNDSFKQFRLAGVRQTLVTGLLNTFTQETQKQKIKFEFLRMGLQFDGSKWSLSGFDGRPIVTVAATSVWLSGTEKVRVPARMVLGNEVSRRLDYTLFENGSKYFLVPTKMVTYL